MSNRIKFAIVFVIVNLHIVRNLSLVLYLAVFLPMVFMVSVDFLTRTYRQQLPKIGSMFYLWIGFAILGLLISFLLISPVGSITGLTRFLFATPVFMALVLYTDDSEDLATHISTFVYFFVVASMSLPLQFVVGPISWFAEASSRAGLERYSSLLGSLTSIGVIVGSYLLLIEGTKSRIKFVLIIGMVLPAVVSLNKAAMVNIAIAIIGLIVLNRRSLSRLALFGTGALAVSLAAYSLLPVLQERIDASLQSFGLQTSSGMIIRDDVSIQTSVMDRLVGLPLANLRALADLNSPLSYLLGGGFGMGNTALVPLEDVLAPMAHNQYAEVMTVFGFIGGTVFVGIMLRIQILLVRKWRNDVSPVFGSLALAFLVFLVNSLFANGTLYQPASASFFFLAMFAASSDTLIQRGAPFDVAILSR